MEDTRLPVGVGRWVAAVLDTRDTLFAVLGWQAGVPLGRLQP